MAQRSNTQNKAMHKYFDLVADALKENDITMQAVYEVNEVEIEPSTKAIKEVWRGIQDAALGKDSTADLDTAEVTKMYDTFNKMLGENFGIHVPFPTNDYYRHES